MPWIKSGETTFHICQRGVKRRRCSFCNTGWIDKLCDFPTKPGRTCSVGMCARCATSVGHELDYCPRHRGQKPAQGDLALFTGGKDA